MKKYEMYKCELCETMYNNQAQAISCEKCHIKDFQITNKRYVKGIHFPVSITVSNGKEYRIYK